ncbi:MAG: sulfite exporter TauE/SafE [Alphaproteobacteria bacterium]|nr:sulfite exporter TauE/SafE [Alphaproteobacteria bacterium]
MELYLPIAEMSVNALALLVLGLTAGFFSGLFGIGGGFLLTPALIFIGVPPAVAVGSQAAQILATSVSSLDQQWRRGNVDFRMGFTMLAGGLVGSALGVQLFGYLKAIGQIDVVIALAFIIMLSTMGTLMLVESSRTILRQKLKKPATRRKLHQHYWVARWPVKVRYPKSRLYVSVFLPMLLGLGGGVLSAIMGIGGGFLLVPAMIYLLGMPTLLVIGTSALQIVFVAANVTILQAWQNETVDLFLALMMIAGGVIGAPLGSRLSVKLPGEHLRGLLAVLLVGMAIKLLVDMVVTPEEIYVLSEAGK